MKIIAWLDENFERFCCTTLYMIFAIVMIVNVIMRFVFENAIPWASDLVLYLFIWFVMFGISYCFKTKTHIAVTFVVDSLPKKYSRYVSIGTNVILFLFVLLLFYNSIILLNDRSVANKFGVLVRYPLWTMYFSLTISCALSLVRLAQSAYKHLKTPFTEERK